MTLTKRKSDLPVASPKPAAKEKTQPRKAKPSVMRVTPHTRHCACGCGESFTPYRPSQRFVEDHRFRTYKSCTCPTCGTTHREKVRL